MTSIEIVKQYYSYFNQRNWAGMLSLLDPQIRHEPNQGEPRIGIELFKQFLQHMDECYEENLTDIVFLNEASDKRIAAEFIVNGKYKKGEKGLPEAKGQNYTLPAAAFLEVAEGRITRITTYYNLPLWIQLVS